MIRALLTQRIVLLAVLIVVVVVWFTIMGANDYLTGDYDSDYLAASLINAVPLAMLGFAELLVILSGRGGIDLSVGAMVSLSGMIFGFAYGQWGWPLWLAILLTILAGGVLGAVNGFLVAYIGFPALIATLATFYTYKSLAVVINNQLPISTKPIQDLFDGTAKSVELPVIGGGLPDIPLGVFLFLIPTMVIIWLLLARTTYGRRVYAVGTNDVAARWSAIDVAASRAKAYVLSGLISGLVAVVTVGQFASARPDAGVSGNGMALPAITIAVLGRRRHHRRHRPGVRHRAGHRADRLDERRHPAGVRGQRRAAVPAARPRPAAGVRRPAQRSGGAPIRRGQIADASAAYPGHRPDRRDRVQHDAQHGDRAVLVQRVIPVAALG